MTGSFDETFDPPMTYFQKKQEKKKIIIGNYQLDNVIERNDGEFIETYLLAATFSPLPSWLKSK